MKHVTLLVGLLLAGFGALAQPCTTTNAGGCGCRDGSTNCDLLPDITISWEGIRSYLGGPEEFSQTGNGVDNGRLKITGSTPNIGYGSFTVRGTNWFVCGVDTFQYTNGTPPPCPGGALPRQLLHQRIYHKNGAQMSFHDRFAGAMTYHPTHGHNHVDDWAIFTLRLRDSSQVDPRQWPIVGTGAKVGFCLMDYYSCTDRNAAGHCRDSNEVFLQGNALNTTASFPNYGLGGGQYNCSPIEQGISSGYTDVYSKNLDGMWINVPADLCNGQYWIVMEVDPHNFFQEENELNNYTAVPYTLTHQIPTGQGGADITIGTGNRAICPGGSVELTASPGWRYLWSNGETTRTIQASTAGTYTVTVDSYCGHNTSAPVVLTMANAPAPAPTAIAGDTVCTGASATLTATGSATLQWLDGTGAVVGTGSSFTTPALLTSTTYYVRNTNITVDTAHAAPVDHSFGGGGYLGSSQGLIFNADAPFTLVSCVVDASVAGLRTFELRNDYGLTIATRSVQVPAGVHRITLNLPITAGRGWRLLAVQNGSSIINLYRNNTGAAYPYALPGVVTITGSTSGNDPDSFYYFFYDWKVETTVSDCGASPVAVEAIVANTPPSIAALQNVYPEDAAPVALVGSPAGGTFSGPGVVNNLFYPDVAGIGGPYTLTYTYVNSRGCTTTASVSTAVSQPLGVAATVTADGLSVAPNPAHDRFRVELTQVEAAAGRAELFDMLGRAVVRRTLAPATKLATDVSVAGLPAGPYVLRLTVGARQYVRRVVVE